RDLHARLDGCRGLRPLPVRAVREPPRRDAPRAVDLARCRGGRRHGPRNPPGAGRGMGGLHAAAQLVRRRTGRRGVLPLRRRGVGAGGCVGHTRVLERRTSPSDVGGDRTPAGVQRAVHPTPVTAVIRPSSRRTIMADKWEMSRRGFLVSSLGAGALLLSSCATGGTGPSGGGGGGGGIVLQSSLSDPAPKKALEKLVAGYKSGGVTLNTVAIEQFRAQLSTYLTSAN